MSNWNNMCSNLLGLIFCFLSVHNNNINLICKKWITTKIYVNNLTFDKYDCILTMNKDKNNIVLSKSEHTSIIIKKIMNKIYTSRLQHIDLRHNVYITDKCMMILNEYNLTNLLYFNLRNININSKGIRNINKLIKLQYLNLSETALIDEDLIILRNLINLQHLDISYTKITGSAFEYLPDLLNLTELNLNTTHTNDQAIKYLINFVNLKQLKLQNTYITDKCVKFLKKMLKLEHLDLSYADNNNNIIEELTFDLKSITYHF